MSTDTAQIDDANRAAASDLVAAWKRRAQALRALEAAFEAADLEIGQEMQKVLEPPHRMTWRAMAAAINEAAEDPSEETSLGGLRSIGQRLELTPVPQSVRARAGRGLPRGTHAEPGAVSISQLATALDVSTRTATRQVVERGQWGKHGDREDGWTGGGGKAVSVWNKRAREMVDQRQR